jgi:hypothetical protein
MSTFLMLRRNVRGGAPRYLGTRAKRLNAAKGCRLDIPCARSKDVRLG